MQRQWLQLNQHLKKYMKRAVVYRMMVVIFSLFPCKKDATGVSNSKGIGGKWSIITDSTYAGVGAGNHPVIYVGQEGDYFDFQTSGKLYSMENGRSYILSYTLTSDTTIVINSFLSDTSRTADSCTVAHSAAHTTSIGTSILLTPGGTFGRKTGLRRKR